jgi:RHS repeat-associated protein
LKGRNLKKSGLNKSFRFGFNGMEADDEIKGDGNSYTTEFRQYDSRLGRWLSLDPLMKKYPDQSAYCAFNNNPIYFSDPSGAEGEHKEGDTRTENKVEQVYTGSAEGQGWKNTADVESFPSSGGNGVFFRGGNAGTTNYQLIENVIISIGTTADLGVIGEYSKQVGSENTWLIATDDIESAYALFNTKFGNNTISKLVIDTHAGLGLDITGRGVEAGLVTSSNDLTGVRLTRNGIAEAKKGVQLTVSKIEYDDAVAFLAFTSSIAPGGELLLSGCKAGQDKKLLQAIDWGSKNNFNIYANLDNTLIKLYTNSVQITTAMESYLYGWVCWGIKNENNVETKGATPRYGYKVLKNENTNGVMDFKY